MTANELRDIALLARESIAIDRAVVLAGWIGTRRLPVTAGLVLRKSDVPGAGAALGVDVPTRMRTMADIPALHRPWCVAVATGLLQIGDGWVSGGPALGRWPFDDADLLAGWLAGLRAVCAAESRPHDEDSVRLLAIAVLTTLGEDGMPRTGNLWWQVEGTLRDVCDRYDKSPWEASHAAFKYDLDDRTPLTGLVALLAEFGAVAANPAGQVISPLGRWAVDHLASGLPGRVGTNLPAIKMIAEAARFSDEKQQAHVASHWLAERKPAEAAREILIVADGMSSLPRRVAVRMVERLGEDALPAWRDMASAQCIGPYARAALARCELGPEPSDADWRWIAVEFASAALSEKGPDAALSIIWECMPGADLDADLAAVRAACHPEAEALAHAVAEFAASGAPRSIDQVAELKVSLVDFRPPIWRRVQMPVTATLGELHEVIQVLFGWDGDHLHVFQAGKKQYGDLFAGLEETGDEEEVRLHEVMGRDAKAIKYTYDLGTCWEHEITLESTRSRDPGHDYPVCVGHKGDSPVEYWSEDEDDPSESQPFDRAEVNRKLAARDANSSQD